MQRSALLWSAIVILASAAISARGQEQVAEVVEGQSKIAAWLAPSELKAGLNRKVDDLIRKLQQNPRSAEFLDLLYENKGYVYFSTTCFIIGTSLLLIVLVFYNPALPTNADGRKQKKRFRLADRTELPELERLIVNGEKGRDKSVAFGAAGDMIPLQDNHLSPMKFTVRVDRPAPSWASTLTDTVVTQPRRATDPFAAIIELCKQKMAARFADVLELKQPTEAYAFISRNTNSVLYRFRAETIEFIVKILPVPTESIAERERQLRGVLYLNRLHTSPQRFLCRNFVEIEGAAFVQDDYPVSLLKMTQPSGEVGSPIGSGQPGTFKDVIFSCRNFIVLSLEVAGTPLSRCPIKNAAQAKSIVQQLCFTLAVGERFAGYCIDDANVDKVYLRGTPSNKIDFRLDGISVAVKLIDGVIAKLGGTSFDLGNVSLNENQLIEEADRRIPARGFERNVEFVSRVVKLLLERVPRDVDPNSIRNEQKVIFDLKDIESHLRNFDCVYRFTMFKFIQPRKSLAVVAVNEAKFASVAS